MSEETIHLEFIQQALQELREATLRHQQAGRPIVFVRDGLLIESVNGTETILKKVSHKFKVKRRQFTTPKIQTNPQ